MAQQEPPAKMALRARMASPAKAALMDSPAALGACRVLTEPMEPTARPALTEQTAQTEAMASPVWLARQAARGKRALQRPMLT